MLSTYTRTADNVINLTVRGKEGAGKPETLGITANHLLFSLDRFDGRDPSPDGSWIMAGDLKPCERIRTADGWAIVESVNRQWRTEQVFNLEVEGEHTYLSGTVGAVSHNANRCQTPDQRALKDVVNEVTHGGRSPLSRTDAEVVKQWAKEVRYPGYRAKMGDVSSPSNWDANPVPHIHLPGAGRHGHVPVAPGVLPDP